MSEYKIEIDDSQIVEQVNRIIDETFQREIKRKGSETTNVMSQAVKDIVYSHKDEIIEKVVERAAREIAKKALPQLLERFIKE